jgi:hypothetical protein
MAGAPANLSFLRFSTDELPESERFPTFQDVFGQAIAKVDFEPLAGTHLRVQATIRAMPGLGAWIGSFSPIHGRRTHELIVDGNDDITLCMCSFPTRTCSPRGWCGGRTTSALACRAK